jgi:hypothetical protein
MEPLIGLIGLSAGVFGGFLLSFTGVAVGAAARYGLPDGWRRLGGWALAVAGVILLTVLVVAAVTAKGGPQPRMLDALLLVVASWLPGFVAGALGANRLVLVATLPAAIVLVGFLSQILGPGFGVSLL